MGTRRVRVQLWRQMTALGVLAGGIALGGEISSPKSLKDLEVVASPLVEETGLSLEATRVYKVSSEQMDALNAQDLSSALRRVPGVTISRFNPIGAYGGGDGGAVFVRGHGSGRPGAELSTMIDGIPIYNGVWTHPLLDTLPIDLAQQIQVSSSPQPVLGGNMGFASINLIPKRWLEDGHGGRVVGSYGSNSTWTERFEYGGKKGPVDAYVMQSSKASNGERFNAEGDVDSIFLHLGVQLDPIWSVRFLYTHSESLVDDPREEGAAAIPRTETYETQNDLYILTLQHETEEAEGWIKIYYDDMWAKWEQWDTANGAFDHYPKTDNAGIRLQEKLHLWEGGEWTLGLDHDYQTGRVKEEYETTPANSYRTDRYIFRNTAAYTMLSQDIKLDDVVITPSAGVRYNDSKYFDDCFGSQAGVKVAFGQTTVYGNWSQSFNYPGVYAALFGEQIWGFLPAAKHDDWKELDAEQIDHFEIGVSHTFSEYLKVDLSLFKDEVSDGFRIVTPPPHFAEIGEYSIKGVEAMLTVMPTETFEWSIGVTGMDADPDDTPNAPPWSVSSGIAWRPMERLILNADAQYVDDHWVINSRKEATVQEEVAEFIILNARAEYRLTPDDARTDMRVFAYLENITDEDYEYQPGYPMPGFSVSAGLDVRF